MSEAGEWMFVMFERHTEKVITVWAVLYQH